MQILYNNHLTYHSYQKTRPLKDGKDILRWSYEYVLSDDFEKLRLNFSNCSWPHAAVTAKNGPKNACLHVLEQKLKELGKIQWYIDFHSFGGA